MLVDRLLTEVIEVSALLLLSNSLYALRNLVPILVTECIGIEHHIMSALQIESHRQALNVCYQDIILLILKIFNCTEYESESRVSKFRT